MKQLGAGKTEPVVIEAKIEADLYEAISVLFLRLLGRDQSERPGFLVRKGAGSWYAVVYAGEMPEEIAKHYARSAVVVDRAQKQEGPDALSRVGRGRTGQLALQQLHDTLLEALKLRVQSDLGALELATGQPVPGAPAQFVACNPNADPPDEPGMRKRLRGLPPRSA